MEAASGVISGSGRGRGGCKFSKGRAPIPVYPLIGCFKFFTFLLSHVQKREGLEEKTTALPRSEWNHTLPYEGRLGQSERGSAFLSSTMSSQVRHPGKEVPKQAKVPWKALP